MSRESLFDKDGRVIAFLYQYAKEEDEEIVYFVL